MSAHLARLAQRREGLVAQADAQRTALARTLEPWRAHLALADQGVAAVRYLRRHPALWLGPVLLLAAWRPKAASIWLSRAWAAWRLGCRLLRR